MDMNLQPDVFGGLFDMSRDAVLGVDANGIIAFANPAAAVLLGASAGMPAIGIVPDYILEEQAERFVASAQIGDRSADVSVARQNGMTLLSFIPLPTENEPRNVLSSKALRDMSDYLQSVRVAFDIIVRRTGAESNPSLKEYVTIMYHEYYRMRRLCQHMTYANGILQNNLPFFPQMTDLAALCRDLCDTVDRFSQEMGIAVRFHTDGALYLTMADEHHLEIMLLNLISNSLSHSREGDAIDLDLTRKNNRFVLSLHDRGDGIALDRLYSGIGRVATLDMTDTSAGAGLGLLIARGIAVRHGGALILERRPEGGTSVRISLPHRVPKNPEIRSPRISYRNESMSNILTELSVVLDKKYYDHRMFD